MTDYSSNLAAVEQIPFIELYKFQRGFEYFRYTNHEADVVFQDESYISAAITRGEFNVDTNLSTVSTTVGAAIFDDFGVYIATQPSNRTRLSIRRAVSDDLTEFVVIFDGWVTGVQFNENNEASLSVEQKSNVLSKEVDMFTHSCVCNHNIFYGGCSLDVIQYRLVTSNITVIGSDIYSTEVDTYDDGYFTGGEVFVTDDSRMITNHVGNKLTLHVPFDSRVVTGSEITILPGCDRLITTCINKFDNLVDFLGMPLIPSKNPVIWGF